MSDENQQLEAMLEGLTPQESSRLVLAATKVGIEAQKKFGVAPTMPEVLALSQVKQATLANYEPDISNCLWQLENEAPTVRSHLAAKAVETQTLDAQAASAAGPTVEQLAKLPASVQRYLPTNATFEDISALPPSVRATIGRHLGLAASAPPEAVETVQAAPDAKAAPLAPHAQINAAAAAMDAARKGVQT